MQQPPKKLDAAESGGSHAISDGSDAESRRVSIGIPEDSSRPASPSSPPPNRTAHRGSETGPRDIRRPSVALLTDLPVEGGKQTTRRPSLHPDDAVAPPASLSRQNSRKASLSPAMHAATMQTQQRRQSLAPDQTADAADNNNANGSRRPSLSPQPPSHVRRSSRSSTVSAAFGGATEFRGKGRRPSRMMESKFQFYSQLIRHVASTLLLESQRSELAQNAAASLVPLRSQSHGADSDSEESSNIYSDFSSDYNGSTDPDDDPDV